MQQEPAVPEPPGTPGRPEAPEQANLPEQPGDRWQPGGPGQADGSGQAGVPDQPVGAQVATVMDSARLEAFSDGVFAVAITLLAFDLAVRGPGKNVQLGQLLGHDWPSFASYVVSFLTIGIIWVNHHTLFKSFARVDRTLLFVNLLLLFFVVAIPFATRTVAEYLGHGGGNAALAVALYQAVLEGMSLAFGFLFWWSVRHEHLLVPLEPEQSRRAVIRFSIGNVGYIVAIGVAFANQLASLLISLIVALYYVFEQTPTRSRPPQH